MEFKVGDTVELKSGSPIMTVEAVIGPAMGRDYTVIRCKWFDDKRNVHTESFRPEMLESADT